MADKDKKKVLILGATGMLGSAVYDVLKDRYNLILTARDLDKIKLLEDTYGDTDKHRAVRFDAQDVYQDFLDKKGHPGDALKTFLEEVGDIDYAINAVGITIPFSRDHEALTLFINGALPHLLARELGEKLIHITTDCVYSGIEGAPYDENSQRTPVDLYGLSKSLGEPNTCLTIRTSIVGRELEDFTGLLEWFLQQEGQELGGFSNHYWNGITTKQFGKICDQIMSSPDEYPKTGIYHVFSTTVSKHDMLLKFKEKFNIECEVKDNPEPKLDRTLKTIHDLNDKLNMPSFGEMVDEL
ncbi:MAG: sugar nucleotide-binding protein [Candidatus Colwellbacteria bacterium]